MITNKFESKIKAQQINLNYHPEHLEEEQLRDVGFLYPIVRVGEKSYSQAEIKSLKLDVGSAFLPTLTVSVDDENRYIRSEVLTDEFILEDSILTLFIGNIKDEKYKKIKSDFIITSISSSPKSKNVGFTATLFVPELFKDGQYGYRGTSYETLTKIAKDCELGLNTNIDSTSDENIWITNTNRRDMIQYITTNSYISDTECMYCYVDEFKNLNVIALSKAMADRTQYFLDVDSTGASIKPVKLLLASGVDEKKKEGESYIEIERWSVKSDRTAFVTSFNKGKYMFKADYSSLNGAIEEKDIETTLTLDGQRYYYNRKWSDDYFDYFGVNKYQNNQIRKSLLQGTIITFSTERYTPSVFTSMVADFKLFRPFNEQKEVLDQKSEDKTPLEISEKGRKQERKIESPMSGKYFIKTLSYSYKSGEKIKTNGTGFKV